MTKSHKNARPNESSDGSPAFEPLPPAEYLEARPVAERITRGRVARRETPLDRHARWRPSSRRALDDRMHDFYVRQLWDGKASVEVADLDPAGFRGCGESCGWTLARAHARSGDRIAIATYLGEKDPFDRSIAEYASTYADVNESDHQRFMNAIDDGRLPATVGI